MLSVWVAGQIYHFHELEDRLEATCRPRQGSHYFEEMWGAQPGYGQPDYGAYQGYTVPLPTPGVSYGSNDWAAPAGVPMYAPLSPSAMGYGQGMIPQPMSPHGVYAPPQPFSPHAPQPYSPYMPPQQGFAPQPFVQPGMLPQPMSPHGMPQQFSPHGYQSFSPHGPPQQFSPHGFPPQQFAPQAPQQQYGFEQAPIQLPPSLELPAQQQQTPAQPLSSEQAVAASPVDQLQVTTPAAPVASAATEVNAGQTVTASATPTSPTVETPANAASLRSKSPSARVNKSKPKDDGEKKWKLLDAAISIIA